MAASKENSLLQKVDYRNGLEFCGHWCNRRSRQDTAT